MPSLVFYRVPSRFPGCLVSYTELFHLLGIPFLVAQHPVRRTASLRAKATLAIFRPCRIMMKKPVAPLRNAARRSLGRLLSNRLIMSRNADESRSAYASGRLLRR